MWHQKYYIDVKIISDEVGLNLPCVVCVRCGRLGTAVRASGLQVTRYGGPHGNAFIRLIKLIVSLC